MHYLFHLLLFIISFFILSYPLGLLAQLMMMYSPLNYNYIYCILCSFFVWLILVALLSLIIIIITIANTIISSIKKSFNNEQDPLKVTNIV